MKSALIVQIEVNTPAKADALVSDVSPRVFSRSLWTGQENKVSRGISENGNPKADIEARFDNLVDRDDLAKYLKSLDNRPNVKVTGTIHDCYHDEGGKSCVNWREI